MFKTISDTFSKGISSVVILFNRTSTVFWFISPFLNRFTVSYYKDYRYYDRYYINLLLSVFCTVDTARFRSTGRFFGESKSDKVS